MVYEDLILETDERGFAVVTLNVPQKLNALTRKMRMNLPKAVNRVAKDDKIRALIVTGAGRGFCSGIDLSGPWRKLPRYDRLQVIGWPVADVFPKLNKPVIAAINGACVGAGFSLALSCDIRIASAKARFGAVQIARGLVPDFGMTLSLPKATGMSNALKLMFTGDIIGATEAKHLGIVSQVTEPEDLLKTAQALAIKIAEQAPIAVELTKKIVWRGFLDSLTHQLDLETLGYQICRQTEDYKNSVQAFLEKRPQPIFKGE